VTTGGRQGIAPAHAHAGINTSRTNEASRQTKIIKPYECIRLRLYVRRTLGAAESGLGANDICAALTASEYSQDHSCTAVRGSLEIKWKERSTGEDSAYALDRQNSGGVLGTDEWATSQIGCRVFVTAASLHAPAVVGLSETTPVQDPAVNLLVPESLAGKPSYTRGAMKQRCALVSGPLQREKGSCVSINRGRSHQAASIAC
jgi:hypothetical protein